MTFISRKRLPGLQIPNVQKLIASKLVVLMLLFAVSGCQFIPSTAQKSTAVAVHAGTANQVENQQDPINATESLSITTPDPFLADQSDVSAAVAEQFSVANQALLKGDWQQAEEQLLALTKKYPHFSGPYLNLANLYTQTDQPLKVRTAFEQAIAANHMNIYAYNQYAIFLREAGDFDGAERLYLQALSVWPDYPDGHLNVAILYDLYMGKLQLALEHYQTYQGLLEQPDREIAGWIIDTQRRVDKNQGAQMAAADTDQGL